MARLGMIDEAGWCYLPHGTGPQLYQEAAQPCGAALSWARQGSEGRLG